MNNRFRIPIAVLGCLAAGTAIAAGNGIGHNDPIAPVILGVTGILFFAIIGRIAARRLNQPSVLGELLIGVVIGNLLYWMDINFILILREGTAIFDMIEKTIHGASLESAVKKTVEKDAEAILTLLQGPNSGALIQIAHTVDAFSRYGIIFLLFLVGLETNIDELNKVSRNSTMAALIGVILPLILGYFTAWLILPQSSFEKNFFIGATLCATSVGITARVLQDLGKLKTKEAHTILGAAVIDDVMGLVLLAIVSGMLVGGSITWSTVLFSLSLTVFVITIAPHALRFVIKNLHNLFPVEAKMFVSFFFVMVLAWLANLVGLATIVGAFAAGLIIRDAYFAQLKDHDGRDYHIKDLITPLEAILVPIFFVLMGIQVKLESFLDWKVLIIAAGLLIAAIIGKLACGLAAGKQINRWAVGFGMLPRGEVGLIFASFGKSLDIINDALFSAVVLVVIMTTFISPPLLKWSFREQGRA